MLVHPEHREVFPLAPEPIAREDGSKKNDCERNAANFGLEVNILECRETRPGKAEFNSIVTLRYAKISLSHSYMA